MVYYLVYRDNNPMASGTLHIRWDMFPHFLSKDIIFRQRLADAMNTQFKSKEVDFRTPQSKEAAYTEMHEFICNFVKRDQPQYIGIEKYLDALRFVEEPEVTTV